MPTVTMLLPEGSRRDVYFQGTRYKLKGMKTLEVPEEVHDYLMSLNTGKKMPLFASGSLLAPKRAPIAEDDDEPVQKKKKTASTKGRSKKVEIEEDEDEYGVEEEDVFGEQKEL